MTDTSDNSSNDTVTGVGVGSAPALATTAVTANRNDATVQGMLV